ncbi:tripartite tricarboxylate transporter substrate-binding protein, partial [Salmonella enterica subsp. enterica]
ENRGGGGGAIGADALAKSAPDGYTIGIATVSTMATNPATNPKNPYDPLKDFAPITNLVNVPNVLTVNPAVLDVKSVKEFIEKVKANPGKYNYASTGNGTGTHLAFAEFNARAGLDMVHVPYKGGPDAL